MSSECEKIEKLLLDGLESLEHEPELTKHLEGCMHCTALKAALATVDGGLAKERVIDAGDDVVASLFKKISAEETARAFNKNRALAFASPFVVLSVVYLTGFMILLLSDVHRNVYQLYNFFFVALVLAVFLRRFGFATKIAAGSLSALMMTLIVVRSLGDRVEQRFSSSVVDLVDKRYAPAQEAENVYQIYRQGGGVGGKVAVQGATAQGATVLGSRERGGASVTIPEMPLPGSHSAESNDQENQKEQRQDENAVPFKSLMAAGESGDDALAHKYAKQWLANRLAPEEAQERVEGAVAPKPSRMDGSAGEEAYNDIVASFGSELDSVKSEIKDIKVTVEEQGKNFEEFEQRTADVFKKMLDRMAEKERSKKDADAYVNASEDRSVDVGVAEPTDSKKDKGYASFGNEASELQKSKKAEKVLNEPAVAEHYFRLLKERTATEKLAFKNPSGYWSNTYVPGDPVLWQLGRQLDTKTREGLSSYLGGKQPLLDDAAQQTDQPFDLPQNSALAVYMHADQAAIEGTHRMLLQVGLQASKRNAGSRPPMNVAIVLDLRGEISKVTQEQVAALLTAFESAQATGDKFSLVVAGRSGETVIPAGEFRHGTVMVALQKLFQPLPKDSPKDAPEGLNLIQAIERGIVNANGNAETNAALGTNMVVLVTAQSLGAFTDTAATMAHQSALNGVPMSVIGIGDAVSQPEIERVTIAGQGNRRLLTDAAGAKDLVDRELAAQSRVVARAVRLRIRLAPGVKLVDVLGSQSLDQQQSERVREMEQSIDKRVSKTLGIEADRGEDQDGIQIVIPAFYSGDAHVILLDVVAPGPGAVGEVSAQYKDLVFMKNGVSRADLSVAKGTQEPGLLEINVVKNFLAHRLSTLLQTAGRSLSAGKQAEARAMAEEFKQLLKEMQAKRPHLSMDLNMQRDIAMLDEYLLLLDPKNGLSEGQRQYVAGSMLYAGKLKLSPRPRMS